MQGHFPVCCFVSGIFGDGTMLKFRTKIKPTDKIKESEIEGRFYVKSESKVRRRIQEECG